MIRYRALLVAAGYPDGATPGRSRAMREFPDSAVRTWRRSAAVLAKPASNPVLTEAAGVERSRNFRRQRVSAKTRPCHFLQSDRWLLQEEALVNIDCDGS
jgi:hypothetical protein